MSSSQIETKSNAQPIAGLHWILMPDWPEMPSSSWPSLTLVDLFCSCGGMTLGAWEGARLSKRRLNVRLAIDISRRAATVYSDNFGDITEEVRAVDVSKVFDGNSGDEPSDIELLARRRVGKLDILVAGPPCQGHSDLNNSTRRRDPRNALYLCVPRAAEVLNPKVVVIENVPAVQHDKGKSVELTKEWLTRMGYHVSTGVIQLSRFGIPQTRKRHFMIATRGDRFDLSALDDIEHPQQTLGMFVSGLEDSANTNGLMSTPARIIKRNRDRVKYLFEHGLYDLPDDQRPACHRDKEHAYVSMYGRMYWDKPAQTVTSGFGSMGQGRYVHPTRQRLITPHEAARLQGLPDFFDFSSVATLGGLREMIANVVPPQFMAALVARLIEKRLL